MKGGRGGFGAEEPGWGRECEPTEGRTVRRTATRWVGGVAGVMSAAAGRGSLECLWTPSGDAWGHLLPTALTARSDAQLFSLISLQLLRGFGFRVPV